MIKHSQTTGRQKPANCLSVFDHFVGFALKGLSALFFLAQQRICFFWVIFIPFFDGFINFFKDFDFKHGGILIKKLETDHII